jgi:hypothetical protein
MVGLAAWRAAVPGAFGTMLIRLFLALLVLGWPIVTYLHIEFATESGEAASNVDGPLFIVVRQLEQPSLATKTWIIAVGLAACGVATWGGRRLARRYRSRVCAPQAPA